LGSSCDNIFGFQAEVNKMKKKSYPDTGNWKTSSYNKCAREGADATVKDYEKQCIGDDSSLCVELGETAAEIIVYSNVCPQGYSPSRYQNYKKTCRQVAYGICQGAIQTKMNEQCSKSAASQWKSTSKLNQLMDMCEGQVDSMTNNGREEEDEFEFTMN
jgi:hypothetical protein